MMETWLVITTLKDDYRKYEKPMSLMIWWHLQEAFQQGKLGKCGVVVGRDQTLGFAASDTQESYLRSSLTELTIRVPTSIGIEKYV